MKKIIIGVGALALFAACSGNKTTGETVSEETPISVIFETDMGNDVDDALAFDMLMKYAEEGKIKLLGVSSNKRNPGSIAYLDQLTTWYGHPEIPLGYVVDGKPCDDAVDYAQAVVDLTDSTGVALFARSHATDNFAKPSVQLYRELLSAQPDSSVTIVSVGFSTNLAQLLASNPDDISPLPGDELVAKKVNRLITMAGEFRANADADSLKRMSEYNVVRDVDAAKMVFEQWPTEVVTSPFELGIEVLYPATSIENDFTWVANHPVVEAYKAYMPMPYDRPTWDLTSVLYAVEGPSDYFTVSEPGYISVDPRGATKFTPSAEGNRYILQADSTQRAAILNRFVELIPSKPAAFK